MAEITLFYLQNILKHRRPELVRGHHVQSLGLFGSYVRQEQHLGIDLDVLVSFTEPPSLLKLIAFENYLTDLLGVKVDLVIQDALKPCTGQHILHEVIDI